MQICERASSEESCHYLVLENFELGKGAIHGGVASVIPKPRRIYIMLLAALMLAPMRRERRVFGNLATPPLIAMYLDCRLRPSFSASQRANIFSVQVTQITLPSDITAVCLDLKILSCVWP